MAVTGVVLGFGHRRLQDHRLFRTPLDFRFTGKTAIHSGLIRILTGAGVDLLEHRR
jgi:hypothetical protein